MKSGSTNPVFTKKWHRAALFVLITSLTMALLPMLFWPLANAARVFCILCGSIGMTAMMLLMGATLFHFVSPDANGDTAHVAQR